MDSCSSHRLQRRATTSSSSSIINQHHIKEFFFGQQQLELNVSHTSQRIWMHFLLAPYGWWVGEKETDSGFYFCRLLLHRKYKKIPMNPRLHLSVICCFDNWRNQRNPHPSAGRTKNWGNKNRTTRWVFLFWGPSIHPNSNECYVVHPQLLKRATTTTNRTRYLAPLQLGLYLVNALLLLHQLRLAHSSSSSLQSQRRSVLYQFD